MKIIFIFFLLNLVWADPNNIEKRESKLDVPYYYTVNGGPGLDYPREMLGPFSFLLGHLFTRPNASNEVYIYGSSLKKQEGSSISRELKPLMCLEKADVCALLEAKPSHDKPEAYKPLSEMIRLAKENPYPEATQYLKESMEDLLGVVKTAFIFSHLKVLSVDELVQVAGLEGHQDFLVLRRFGYIRNRMEGEHGPVQHHNHIDITLFDSTHPYTPGWIPPSALKEEDSHATFNVDNNPRTTKDLQFMWGQFSSRFHELALQHYENERLKGQRQIFTKHLLQQLREDNSAIDLERAFFFTVEDYAKENVHATIALIDGDKSHREGLNNHSYELPVVRNILKVDPTFNFREKFKGKQVFEVHSLAKNPDKNKEIPLESLALLIADHLETAGFEDSYLLVQTDKAGARRFKHFGFSVDEEASAKLGGEMRALYVKTSDFIRETKRIYPIKGRINVPLPNPITKRLSHKEIDAACLVKLRSL